MEDSSSADAGYEDTKCIEEFDRILFGDHVGNSGHICKMSRTMIGIDHPFDAPPPNGFTLRCLRNVLLPALVDAAQVAF